MSGLSLKKEFRDQLRTARTASAEVVQDYRPRTLHRLRSSILRLGLLIKYCTHDRNKDIYRRLMEFRRAMAECRDYDVCLQRVREDLSSLRLSKKICREILKEIKRERAACRDKLDLMLRSKTYRKLLSRLEGSWQSVHDADIAEVIERDRKALALQDWQPTEFHNIRKRLRALNYFLGSMLSKKDRRNINRTMRYQELLGDYIDGQNTVNILTRMVRQYQEIKLLCRQEKKKMAKTCREIKSSLMSADFRNARIASQGNRP